MSLAENLRTKLLADSILSSLVGGSRVHQNQAVEHYVGGYVWFARAGLDPGDRELDQPAGTRAFEELFDVECISLDVATAEDLADRVRVLDCHRGSLGTGQVQAVLVIDQSDDYVPRGVGSDDGLHVCALRLTVIGYSE